MVTVLADIFAGTNEEGIPCLHEIGAAVRFTLAPVLFVTLLLHIFSVEVYLNLTQVEAKRLRRVSRERQLARRWSKAGTASWLNPRIWGDMGDESDDENRASSPDLGSGGSMSHGKRDG